MQNYIEPINRDQQSHIIRLVETQLEQAASIFNTRLDNIPVLFDLKGRCAGMYRIKNGHSCIRFNPHLFAKYFDDNLANTVPHEIAHYVTDVLYGLKNIRPHGMEWREVMHKLDAPPLVTAHYDLSGIPIRQYKKYSYQCICAKHELGEKRHRNIEKGKAMYYCKKCSSMLMPALLLT